MATPLKVEMLWPYLSSSFLWPLSHNQNQSLFISKGLYTCFPFPLFSWTSFFITILIQTFPVCVYVFFLLWFIVVVVCLFVCEFFIVLFVCLCLVVGGLFVVWVFFMLTSLCRWSWWNCFVLLNQALLCNIPKAWHSFAVNDNKCFSFFLVFLSAWDWLTAYWVHQWYCNFIKKPLMYYEWFPPISLLYQNEHVIL